MFVLSSSVFAAAAVAAAVGAWVFGLALSPLAIITQALLITFAVGATVYFLLQRRSRPAPVRRFASAATPLPPDFDSVTHTLNAGGITVKLLELMALGDRYGNKLSVAIAGVDHLKEVNKRYGREVGDRALRAIAGALAETIRMPDRLGRHADDNFLIILPETDILGAQQIAERLRCSICQVEIDADERTRIGLTASIGVTAFRRGDDLENLLSRAARAMRQAKLLGRNRVLTDLAA